MTTNNNDCHVLETWHVKKICKENVFSYRPTQMLHETTIFFLSRLMEERNLNQVDQDKKCQIHNLNAHTLILKT